MKHTAQEKMLDNGIKVLLIDVPGSHSFDMAVAINAGYRFAADDENTYSIEIPHILEHSVFDGSKNYRSNDALLSVFDRSGGQWNGMTTPYHNLFMFSSKPENAKDIIHAALDMVFFPTLSEQSFDEELRVVANELEEKMSDFALNASQYTQQAILPDLDVSIDRSLMYLEWATHNEVIDYHKKYYTTSNTSIVIACNLKEVSYKTIHSAVLSATKDAPEGKKRAFPRFPMNTSADRGAQFEQLNRSTRTSTLSLQYIKSSAFISAEDSAIRTIKAMLFTNMVTTMRSYSVQHRLRKQGLAYGVSFAGVRSLETSGFEFLIEGPNDHFNELLIATLSMTIELARTGINDDQFDALKAALIESYDKQQSSDDIIEWYLEDYLVEGTLLSRDDYKELAKKITQKDVLSFANDILQYQHQFASIFSAKSIRKSVSVDFITENVFAGNNPSIKGAIGDEFNSWYVDDPDAKGFRRLSIFINTRPFLAWSWTFLELAVGFFFVYRAWFQPDNQQWWHIALGIAGIITVIDALGDIFIRYRHRKKKVNN